MNISNDVNQLRVVDPNTAPAATQAATTVAAVKGSDTVSGSATAAARVGDQTTLSSTSGVLSSALSGSDVRTAKVASLQASINAGTYNVPAGDVADKIISSILG